MMGKGFVGTSLDDVPNLPLGAHVCLVSSSPSLGLQGRQRAWEVRDTLLVLTATGPLYAFLFRTPLQEATVAKNMLRYGTGALWIDGCRVGLSQGEDTRRNPNVIRPSNFLDGSIANVAGSMDDSALGGRWPSNLVLIHGEGCRHVGTKKFKPIGSTPKTNGTRGGLFIPSLEGQPNLTDGLQEMSAWECAEECPVRVLDGQAGVLTSGAVASHHMRNATLQPSRGGYAGGFRDFPLMGYGDEGGASRFFPQFKNMNACMEWLNRLIGNFV